LFAYPDELLNEAIARMATRGLHQLPVITRDAPAQVVGVLTQEGITLAKGVFRTKELLRLRREDEQLITEAGLLETGTEPETALL
jgi:predicted transcriptional regulator